MASGIEDTDLLERIHSGLISREAFEEEVVNQVYSGLKRYCRIPDAYQHCELDCAQVELDQLSDSELKFLLDNRATRRPTCRSSAGSRPGRCR